MNNRDQRLGEAKRDGTSNQKIKKTIENDCLIKPKMIVNVWTNTRTITITANIGMRSRNGESSGSGVKSLEPAKGLEPTATPDVQEVDVGR